MTSPTGIRSGAGFRSATIFALDENGYPASTLSTTPYEGVQFSGAKVLTITDPEPRKIYHTGEDTIIAAQLLPPLEGISGELHAGKVNDILDAMVSNQKAFSVAETALYGEGTNKRGYEQQVAVLAFQHAPDTDVSAGSAGLSGWSGILMPKAFIFQRETGFTDQAMDRVYTVMPMIVSQHLWGTAFTDETEGFLRTQLLRTYGRGRPKIISWKQHHTTLATVFTFPVTAPPISIAKVQVWVNGALATGTTVTLTNITFAVAPTADANITVLYEY